MASVSLKGKTDKEVRDYYRACVTRGAQLLDEMRPGWDKEIELAEFDIRECNHCILGQIYGSYMRGLDKLDLVTTDDDPEYHYGFDVICTDLTIEEICHHADILGAIWREEITSRRNP